MSEHEPVSPKQAAQALGVSEASIKRWCDRGLLKAEVTAGGHRRLAVAEVLRFAKDSGARLVRPELVGLPSTTGTGERATARAVDEAFDALCAGDGERVRRLLTNLWMSERSVADLGDRVVAPAFRRIGEGWDEGDVYVHQERRACEACLDALHALEAALPMPDRTSPLAIGGVLEGDPYTLATRWCAAVLREEGFRAESYGVGLPAAELADAIKRRKPRLAWISVSANSYAPDRLRAAIDVVRAAAREVDAVLAAGGRELPSALKMPPDVRVCRDLRELAALAAPLRGLRRRAKGKNRL